MKRGPISLLAVSAVSLAFVSGAAAAPSPELSPAARSLSQCVQSGHRLSVLILVDESGSLRETDPEGRRVDGIRAALAGLAQLAETPVDGVKPEVSVLMAGFYARAHPDPQRSQVGPAAWKRVDRSTIGRLEASAAAYGRLDQRRATDYGTALIAARELLAERAITESEGARPPPCQALIWFTDGRYSLPRRVGKAGVGLPKTVPYAPGIRLDRPGGGERAVEAGRRMLCKPGGVMDEIAAAGVVRFTVALSTQLSTADAAFLDAVTTGVAGAQRCGAELSGRTGEYLRARDSDRLLFAFGGLLSAAPEPHTTVVCGELDCVRGTTSFSTVPGLSEFLIRASSGVEGAVLELRGPDGERVELGPDQPNRVELSGSEIEQRWVSPTAVVVRGELPPGDESWVGAWSYAFVDPAQQPGQGPALSRSTVQLYADLEPVIVGKPTLIRGSRTKLTLALVRPAAPQDPIEDGPLLDAASLTATVDDPVAETSTPVPVSGPDEDGLFSTRIEVPQSSSAGFVYVGISAHMAIPGGTPIAPQFRSYSVPVRFPPGQGFPTLAPSSLHLPGIEGVASTEGEVVATGSSVAGGCVWVGPVDLAGPDGEPVAAAVEPAARSRSRCLRVGRDQERALTVRLTPANGETGEVAGTIPVHLASDIVSGSRTISVPVGFVIAKPPNEGRRLALLVLLVALGVALPLLLLHLLNYANARFTAPQDLLALSQEAEVRPGSVQTSRGAAYTDFNPLSLQGESRRARALEVESVAMKTVASGSLRGLFRGPYGVAEVEGGGPLLAGSLSMPLREWPRHAAAEVPLSLAGTWIFVPERSAPQPEPGEDASTLWGEANPVATPASEHGETVRGRLILLIANGGDTEMGERLLADATQALRGAELSAEAEPEQAEADEVPAEGIAARIGQLLGRASADSNGAPDEDEEQPVAAPADDEDPWT